MKKGFDRLRGMATVGAIGLGLLGGGSARAATVTTSVSVTVTGTNFTAWWTEMYNGAYGTCNTTTLGGDFIDCGVSASGASYEGFGISTAGMTTVSNSLSDFYDGGLNFSVDGAMFVNPDNTVDLTGTTVTTDVLTDITAGIDAQIQYYFSPDRAVVRALYTLTNTTGAAISVHALVSSDMGSDGNTTIQATSSGDTVWTASDQWVVTNDNTTVGNDPVNDPAATFATWGTGAGVMPSIAFDTGAGDGDKIGARYDVTVPANGTARILVFNEMNMTNAAASAGAPDFESLSAADAAGLLTGLDAQTQSEIVNYGPVTVVPTGGKDSWWERTFSLDVPGLLALCGSLLWFRTRGRKRQA